MERRRQRAIDRSLQVSPSLRSVRAECARVAAARAPLQARVVILAVRLKDVIVETARQDSPNSRPGVVELAVPIAWPADESVVRHNALASRPGHEHERPERQ